VLRRPLLTSATVGTLIGATLVIYLVAGESDLDSWYILVFGGMVGFGSFGAALLVLWLVEILTRSNE
jgi:hypothetical protein